MDNPEIIRPSMNDQTCHQIPRQLKSNSDVWNLTSISSIEKKCKWWSWYCWWDLELNLDIHLSHHHLTLLTMTARALWIFWRTKYQFLYFNTRGPCYYPPAPIHHRPLDVMCHLTSCVMLAYHAWPWPHQCPRAFKTRPGCFLFFYFLSMPAPTSCPGPGHLTPLRDSDTKSFLFREVKQN